MNGAPDCRVVLAHGGERRVIDVAQPHAFAAGSAAVAGDEVVVFHQGLAFAFSTRGAAADAVEHAAADGTIVSPMPGRIIAAEVRVGDSIVEGSKLVTLEAMKMEHSLTAPFDGIVTELNAVEGAQVSEGDVLARIERREA